MAPRVQPGNPEWIAWLEELVEREQARESKAAGTYFLGVKSLRKCPIRYTHPEEALCLNGIGPRTVEYLEKQIRNECARTGDPVPERPVRARAAPKAKTAAQNRKADAADDSDDARIAAKEARRAKTGYVALTGPPLPAAVNPNAAAATIQRIMAEGRNGALGAPGASGGRVLGAAPVARRLVDSDDDSPDDAPAPKKRAKSGENPGKEYVPRQRSGAYGILIGLYSLSSYAEQETWATKAAVITAASPYCDKSYEQPAQMHQGGYQAGGKNANYTAWSGNAILTKHDLWQRNGKRPEKFALTEKGYALAEILIKTTDVQKHPRIGGPSSGNDYAGKGVARRRDDHAPEYDFNRLASPPPDESTSELEEREFQKALALSLRESQQPSSSDAPPPVRARSSLPLPLPKPLAMPYVPKAAPRQTRDDDLDFLSSTNGSSRDAAAGPSRARPSGAYLDPRKAASGAIARSSRPPEVGPVSGGTDGPFHYIYLDEDDNRVDRRSLAEEGQDEKLKRTFRVEFPIAQALHKRACSMQPKPSELVRAEPLPGGRTLEGFLQERHAVDKCPGLPDHNGKAVALAPPKTDNFASLLSGFVAPPKKDKAAMYAAPPEVRRSAPDESSDSEMEIEPPIRAPRPQLQGLTSCYKYPPAQPAAAPAARAGPSTAPLARTQSAPTAPNGAHKNLARPASSVASLPQEASTLRPIMATYDRPRGSTIINRHPLDPVMDHISATTVFPAFSPILLHPGTFKVVVIIDTREVAGSKKNRIEIVDRLEAGGVDVERRMLPLGDMIWVARRIGPDGRETGEDDIVLDAIVERKRLDDLCISIRDGRYTGQKIRMKNSAISHRIYLIEKYDTEKTYKEWGAQIWTAKSQLQINDGFYVHISANIEETIGYLKLRTQVMKELHENSTLYVIPDQHIDRPSYLGLQQYLRINQPDKQFLTTYASFDGLNRTDAALTLRQQWATMIQHVNGISAEKAGPFIHRWPTPVAFFEDAVRHEREVADKNARLDREPPAKGKAKRRKPEEFVLEELGDAGGQRAIKGALAAKLWHLATATGKYPVKGQD